MSERTTKYVIIFSYFLLLIGAITSMALIQTLGCVLLLSYILTSRINKAMLVVMSMVPNITAFTISDVGSNFLGLSFLIILFKLMSGQKVFRLPAFIVIVGIYLLFISSLRVLNGNFYDFAIVSQIIIVLVAWYNIVKSINVQSAIKYIEFFRFGCLLMTIGMIIQYPFEEDGIGRFHAVLDDCNYTGGVSCVLMCVCLLTYCHKLPIPNNRSYMALALVSGLMSGSRGFMLSTAVALLILLITKSFGKQTSKFVFAFLLLLAGFYALYLVGVGPVVTVYDNTIGRTVELNDSHEESEFMDVTSGRSFLWAYYMGNSLQDNFTFFFGRGFYNYFKEENGGFGLAAHNMYVSSIVGIGILGTVLLLFVYFKFIRDNMIGLKRKIGLSFNSLTIAMLTCYFFLDGMLETRFVSYFAIVLMLVIIWKNKYLSI